MKKRLYLLMLVPLLAACACSAPVVPSGESTAESEISADESKEIIAPEPLCSSLPL